jgi:hypothetical protein
MLHSRAAGLHNRLIQGASLIALIVLTVATIRLFNPRRTHAQSAQLDAVRASSFTLVGPDGTVLATLAPGEHGNGHLDLFDTTGRRTVTVTGGSGEGGAGVQLYDAEGHARVQLFYSNNNNFAALRVLGADGKPRAAMSNGTPPGGAEEATSFLVYDPSGNPRAGIGTRREDGSYAVTVRDASGGILDTLPALP